MDYQHEMAVIEYAREERLNNMKNKLNKNKSDPCAGCIWPQRHDGKTVCPFVRCVERSGFIAGGGGQVADTAAGSSRS